MTILKFPRKPVANNNSDLIAAQTLTEICIKLNSVGNYLILHDRSDMSKRVCEAAEYLHLIAKSLGGLK